MLKVHVYFVYLSYPLDSILLERPLLTLNLMPLNYLTSYASGMMLSLSMSGLTCHEYFAPGPLISSLSHTVLPFCHCNTYVKNLSYILA